MAIREFHTPAGIVLEEYKDDRELLKGELAKASSMQEEIDAIKKFLGVL